MAEGQSWAERQERAAFMARSLAGASAVRAGHTVEQKKKLWQDSQKRIDRVRKATRRHYLQTPTVPTVVMKPVVVPELPLVDLIPDTFLPVTIIPEAVAEPTAAWGSGGIPFTYAPMSAVLVSAAVGAMVLTVGRRLLLTMAMTGLEFGLQQVMLYQKGYPGLNVRFHTGKGAGRGRYVRPRPEGGGFPDDDADPHQSYTNPEKQEFWA